MYCVDLYSRVRRACPVEGISHRLRLRNAPSPLKPIYSDNALIGIPDVAMKPPSAVITLPDNYVLSMQALSEETALSVGSMPSKVSE